MTGSLIFRGQKDLSPPLSFEVQEVDFTKKLLCRGVAYFFNTYIGGVKLERLLNHDKDG
jgi:hypothetical protein